MEVLRHTTSVCSLCLKDTPAMVLVEGGKIFLEKSCAEHGNERTLLSKNPDYYRKLDSFFFDVMGLPCRQRDYIIRLTEKCNLDCPICLASANKADTRDLSIERLQAFFDRKKRIKVDLMSAEPTVREDLFDIVKCAKRCGHMVALHTNGIRLQENGYVRNLKKAGVGEVFLQFDGLSDKTYITLRGEPLKDAKFRVLENLRAEGIATSLVVTVAKNLNEDAMVQILEIGANYKNIREVFFLGLRYLGSQRVREEKDDCLLPDELIDIACSDKNTGLTRNNVKIFQMLYFSLLSLFRIRKCFYVQHYLMVRKKKKLVPIDQYISLPAVERVLLKFQYLRKRRSMAAFPYLIVRLFMTVLKPRSARLVVDFMVLNYLLAMGFDLSSIPSRFVLIGFITACDPMIMDHSISAYCGKGEFSADLGEYESGSVANIMRERLFSNLRTAGRMK